MTPPWLPPRSVQLSQLWGIRPSLGEAILQLRELCRGRQLAFLKSHTAGFASYWPQSLLFSPRVVIVHTLCFMQTSHFTATHLLPQEMQTKTQQSILVPTQMGK